MIFKRRQERYSELGKYMQLTTDDDSTRLWVIASHVDIPPGKFAQTRVFAHLPGNKLFINCPDNAWYQQGIPGHADSIEEMVALISDLMIRLKCDEVCLVGHSMGAYLALLLGLMLPDSTVIATSPEFELSVKGSRSERNSVEARTAWASLYELAEARNLSTKAITLMGVDDPIDAYFLSRSETYNPSFGQVYEVPYHHGITEFLNGAGKYLPMLTQPAEVIPGLLHQGVLQEPFANGNASQYLHFYRTSLEYQEPSKPPDLIRAINRFSLWEHAGWQELRSKAFRRLGDARSAFAAASLAYNLRPEIPQIALEYGSAALAAGEYSSAIHLYDNLINSNARHPLHKRFVKYFDANYRFARRAAYNPSNRSFSSPLSLVHPTLTAGPPADFVRMIRALFKAKSEDKIFEALHAARKSLLPAPEILRIAAIVSAKHKLNWLCLRYLNQLANLDGLTVAQTRGLLRLCLKLERHDIIHRYLPRISREAACDPTVLSMLRDVLARTSEPNLALLIMSTISSAQQLEVEIMEACEQCMQRSNNLPAYADFLVSELPQLAGNPLAIECATRICARAGVRRPAFDVLKQMGARTMAVDLVGDLLPTHQDRQATDTRS